MSDWRREAVQEAATGRTWRILERYLLPGKDTGFVLVCEGRACFTAIRDIRTPLGLLPADISPESRLAVIRWAQVQSACRYEELMRCASAGIAPPHPFDRDKGGK
jgi:hypothetical protein